MAERLRIRVNGRQHDVAATPDTPLLYVLGDELDLTGPRFGCGLAQCGSCSVLVDGVEVRSCVTPVAAVAGKVVTTLEGLPQWFSRRRGLKVVVPMHPVQQALLDAQAPQCGYCYNGMVIKAAELLESNADPSDAQIVAAMNGHLCRCGTYPRILEAIRNAARSLSGTARGRQT